MPLDSCIVLFGREVLFVYLCVGMSTCVFYVALVLLLWISVRREVLFVRRSMDGYSMVDRAICLLDNLYYFKRACYMAIECLVAFASLAALY